MEVPAIRYAGTHNFLFNSIQLLRCDCGVTKLHNCMPPSLAYFRRLYHIQEESDAGDMSFDLQVVNLL